MGRVFIPLDESLRHGGCVRKWYTLGSEKTGKPDGKTMRGQVELLMRWAHNPDYAEGDPLEETDGDAPPHHDKPPNELRVGLIRARNLRIMDKSLLGKGSSDPFIHFTVGDPLKDPTHR